MSAPNGIKLMSTKMEMVTHATKISMATTFRTMMTTARSWSRHELTLAQRA
jgi:hypothetical protein